MHRPGWVQRSGDDKSQQNRPGITGLPIPKISRDQHSAALSLATEFRSKALSLQKNQESLTVDILLKSGEMDVRGKTKKRKKKERITWYESERKIPGEKDKGCTHKDRGGFST